MWFVFIARILRLVTCGFQKVKQILRNVHLEMQNLPDVTTNSAAQPFHMT